MNKKELKKRKKLIYELISSKEYQPMRAKEIASLLQIPKPLRKELSAVLDALTEDGMITVSKQGKYRKAKERKYGPKQEKKSNLTTGVFIGHPRGYGFVELEDRDQDDIYIPENNVNGAFHQDKVEIQISGCVNGKRREGQVLRVLERGITEVVGTFEKSRHYGFVVPDNAKMQQDIFIPQEHGMNAQDGDKVVVQITSYGSRNKSPEGRIKEVLGKSTDPGIDVLSVARSYGLPMEFPARVLQQAGRILPILQDGDFSGRKDLRHLMCVTIDGEDAKDLDDAITLAKTEDGYELGVHIADVTNYVQENSALDREALKRGTSVYLVDRVIPMLPKELSNGICSLNQGEDRLALSCLMSLNEKGKLKSHEIAETVIRVDRRMTYTAVQQILEGDKEQQEAYQEFVPMFFCMEELSKLLRARREKRGSIDFDFPESKVLLDEAGHPVAVKPYEHNTATKIIEDFMLLANETVASEYHDRELPFVYRIHEEPDADRMEGVLAFLRANQIPVQKAKHTVSPKEVQKILQSIDGMPLEPMVSRLLLRSMKQACYSVEDAGHFGLAAEHYCHFTSPIRRYPDLQIHRIIKDVIRGRMGQERTHHYELLLDDVASKSSMLERRAEEVERETIKLKKAEYMSSHIGETFEGVISGVTGWGIYVELGNTIEGLVSMNSMWDDYYIYDEAAHQLVGEASQKIYRLGQAVRVIVEDADVVTKTVDFRLAEGMEKRNGEGNRQSSDCE
ncbi:ribonuclease R [Ruminococcus gauvreauii]|uniref:Ribonuclease R n=1 Tax=Ruminococcus gauvreauii TaxID=438033 RepID=A0ABY5VFN0_9FIRM|nr:ribonuclease R [Ruminococcus gauvreauii]UWP59209.1 ribonuclease R [Ruminococcus gauvreauii]